MATVRLVLAWAAVAAFQLFGDVWPADFGVAVGLAALFVAMLVVITWCAFAVVEEAEHLAALLGEPLGTLVLTLTIVTIEVALIAAVMLGARRRRNAWPGHDVCGPDDRPQRRRRVWCCCSAVCATTSRPTICKVPWPTSRSSSRSR